MNKTALERIYRVVTKKHKEINTFKELIIKCLFYNDDTFHKYLLKLDYKFDNVLMWNVSASGDEYTVIEWAVYYYPNKLEFLINNKDTFNIKIDDIVAKSIPIIASSHFHRASNNSISIEIVNDLCNKTDVVAIINNLGYGSIYYWRVIYELIFKYDVNYKYKIKHLELFIVCYMSWVGTKCNVANLVKNYNIKCDNKISNDAISYAMFKLLNQNETEDYLALYDMGFRCYERGYEILTVYDERILNTVTDLVTPMNNLISTIRCCMFYNGKQPPNYYMRAVDSFIKDVDMFVDQLNEQYSQSIHNTKNGIVFLLIYINNKNNITTSKNTIKQVAISCFSMDYLFIMKSIRTWKVNFKMLLRFHSNMSYYV